VRIVERWPAILDRIRPSVDGGPGGGRAPDGGRGSSPRADRGHHDELRTKYYQAQTIRTRYTVLDTLQELGLLGDQVETLFAPGGYWHSRPTAD
jgi:glycerol-1-phosphate dehydrogenase [NAD(P)+]